MNKMSSNKISVAEYEEMGKITTRKALEELQKTMEMRNADKSIDSDSESDYELENNIVSEISRSDRNINRIVKNNSLSIPSNSDDRAMCMFNNLIDRNQTLQDKLSKTENSYENIKRKFKELEKKEYTQMVHYTSLESKVGDLELDLKKKEETITNKNSLIKSSTRMGYINRFIIIAQILIISYLYMVSNLDNIDRMIKLKFE